MSKQNVVSLTKHGAKVQINLQTKCIYTKKSVNTEDFAENEATPDSVPRRSFGEDGGDGQTGCSRGSGGRDG